MDEINKGRKNREETKKRNAGGINVWLEKVFNFSDFLPSYFSPLFSKLLLELTLLLELSTCPLVGIGLTDLGFFDFADWLNL